MSKQWINSRGKYYYNDIPVVTDKLPRGVYELNFDAFSKEFFLDYISESFELPEKVYGIEKGLVERITTTYERLNKNFGVLLKGLKGTGKTVIAKQVSNKLGLPVILVNKSYGDMGQFINSIDQDVIMFFDEFEKTYELSIYHDDEDDEEKPGKKSVNQLLTLMDGVFTSKHKRLFLLTTNKVYLPDAMISRPSRIRYVKEFSDLSYEDIIEILTDSVEDKNLIPELAEILKELECITVDIVKSVAEEANIYGVATKEFFSIFNVSRDVNKLDFYEIIKDEEILIAEDVSMNFDHYYVGSSFQLKKSKIFGTIDDIDYENRTMVVKDTKSGKKREFTLKKGQHIHTSMTKYTM
jgi:SpoVK/Ycf46/Vps4 family AAA+-type ATPase